MSNALLNRKTAVVALVATAVLGGGAAFAYPSGTSLTVSATANNTGGTATVTNANPSCKTRIDVEGKTVGVIPAGSTTGTATFSVAGFGTGRHSVRARTINCIKGQKEHAKSKFVILDAHAKGDGWAKAKKTYRIEVDQVYPGLNVTATATLSGTPITQVSDTDQADRRGNVTLKFKFPKPGTWAVVVTTPVGGITSYTVVVS